MRAGCKRPTRIFYFIIFFLRLKIMVAEMAKLASCFCFWVIPVGLVFVRIPNYYNLLVIIIFIILQKKKTLISHLTKRKRKDPLDFTVVQMSASPNLIWLKTLAILY